MKSYGIGRETSTKAGEGEREVSLGADSPETR